MFARPPSLLAYLCYRSWSVDQTCRCVSECARVSRNALGDGHYGTMSCCLSEESAAALLNPAPPCCRRCLESSPASWRTICATGRCSLPPTLAPPASLPSSFIPPVACVLISLHFLCVAGPHFGSVYDQYEPKIPSCSYFFGLFAGIFVFLRPCRAGVSCSVSVTGVFLSSCSEALLALFWHRRSDFLH